MKKAITYSIMSIAIFGIMQTSSFAQGCYFDNITFQPPNFAECYPQQPISSTPKTSVSDRRRWGRLNHHAGR
jgi:hypothetical protein